MDEKISEMAMRKFFRSPPGHLTDEGSVGRAVAVVEASKSTVL
jgi:hypothetical protein